MIIVELVINLFAGLVLDRRNHGIAARVAGVHSVMFIYHPWTFL